VREALDSCARSRAPATRGRRPPRRPAARALAAAGEAGGRAHAAPPRLAEPWRRAAPIPLASGGGAPRPRSLGRGAPPEPRHRLVEPAPAPELASGRAPASLARVANFAAAPVAGVPIDCASWGGSSRAASSMCRRRGRRRSLPPPFREGRGGRRGRARGRRAPGRRRAPLRDRRAPIPRTRSSSTGSAAGAPPRRGLLPRAGRCASRPRGGGAGDDPDERPERASRTTDVVFLCNVRELSPAGPRSYSVSWNGRRPLRVDGGTRSTRTTTTRCSRGAPPQAPLGPDSDLPGWIDRCAVARPALSHPVLSVFRGARSMASSPASPPATCTSSRGGRTTCSLGYEDSAPALVRGKRGARADPAPHGRTVDRDWTDLPIRNRVPAARAAVGALPGASLEPPAPARCWRARTASSASATKERTRCWWRGPAGAAGEAAGIRCGGRRKSPSTGRSARGVPGDARAQGPDGTRGRFRGEHPRRWSRTSGSWSLQLAKLSRGGAMIHAAA